jgi:hypothetical protein
MSGHEIADLFVDGIAKRAKPEAKNANSKARNFACPIPLGRGKRVPAMMPPPPNQANWAGAGWAPGLAARLSIGLEWCPHGLSRKISAFPACPHPKHGCGIP